MQENDAGHYCMETIVEAVEIYSPTNKSIWGGSLWNWADDKKIQIISQMRLQNMNPHCWHMFLCFLWIQDFMVWDFLIVIGAIHFINIS